MICDRPDLLRRVEIGDITINNYYVCETHFPNQILDYATRKILIKTAKPLNLEELKALPKRDDRKVKPRRHSSDEFDMHIEQEFDDDDIDAGDYELDDSNGECTQHNPNINWKFQVTKSILFPHLGMQMKMA